MKVKIKEPNIYEFKHRIIWEKAYGKIPKGYNLIFADGNRQNFNLENLILVSNGELAILNKRNLYKYNAELTKIGVNIAKIIDKLK